MAMKDGSGPSGFTSLRAFNLPAPRAYAAPGLVNCVEHCSTGQLRRLSLLVRGVNSGGAITCSDCGIDLTYRSSARARQLEQRVGSFRSIHSTAWEGAIAQE